MQEEHVKDLENKISCSDHQQDEIDYLKSYVFSLNQTIES